MKIAITGASGLIGSAVATSLRGAGHEVVALVRRPPDADAQEVRWDPKSGVVDLDGLARTDAIIHLAGAGVGDKRWTDAYKREIRDSRVLGTRTIAEAAASLDPKPGVLVSGSAHGYYGDTGERAVDESDPQGDGFLAQVVADWEEAAQPARDAGIRVVHPRTGLVVSAKGGAWGRMFPLFKLGLGGKLASGEQWWSYISLADEVRALRYLVDSDLAGPVNITTPNPERQKDVARAMGRVLGRPTIFPAPRFGLHLVLGEFAGEILENQRVLPNVLEKEGFTFEHPDIETAIRSAVATD